MKLQSQYLIRRASGSGNNEPIYLAFELAGLIYFRDPKVGSIYFRLATIILWLDSRSPNLSLHKPAIE